MKLWRRKPKPRHELAWSETPERIGGDITFPLVCGRCGRLYDRAVSRSESFADIRPELLHEKTAAVLAAHGDEPCDAA